MSKRSDYDHDKRELFVVICDIFCNGKSSHDGDRK